MPDVRLVDLDVIKRFSLAVRRDTAPAEEILEALDASRAVVLAAMGNGGARPTTSRTAKPATRASAGARKASTAAQASRTTKAAPAKSAKPVAKRRVSGS